MKIITRAACAAAIALVPAPALAGEIFGGVFVHDVDTPFTLSGFEDGADVQLGYRFAPILSVARIEPYGFVAVNSAGETHYAAIGVSRKFGDRFYIRPGLGLAIHTGSTGDFQREDRIAFGNRVLFEPEVSIGMTVAPRVSVEASWVHMSHGQVFGGQNPGIDNFGARLNFKL